MPWDEIGVISTLATNVGTVEKPEMVVDDSKCLVHIKALNASIAVLHAIDEVWAWLCEIEPEPM